MGKPRKTARKAKATKTESDWTAIEAAADEIMEEIDGHELSGAGVPKEVSREFWQNIIEHLNTRILALGGE